MGCARVEIIGDLNSRFVGVVLQNSVDIIQFTCCELKMGYPYVYITTTRNIVYTSKINHATVCNITYLFCMVENK
jgi:hypothetical protein